MTGADVLDERTAPTPTTTRPAEGNAVWERPTAARTPALAVAAAGLVGLLAVGVVWLGPTAVEDASSDADAVAVGPAPDEPSPAVDTQDEDPGAVDDAGRDAADDDRGPSVPLVADVVGDAIVFEDRSAALDPAGLATLDAVVEQLEGASAVTVVGWAGPGDDRTADIELSLDRALVVAERLRARYPGIEVGTVGLGADLTDRPLAERQRAVVVRDR